MKLKNMILGAVFALAIFALTTPTHAELFTQLDTNSLAAASTNTYLLTGDVTGNYTNGQTFTTPFVDARDSTTLQCVLGGYFRNSTANASNVTFTIAASVDANNWTNAVDTRVLSIPGNTTNWVTFHFQIANAYPIYCLRSVGNANAANVSADTATVFFKGWSKPGL